MPILSSNFFKNFFNVFFSQKRFKYYSEDGDVHEGKIDYEENTSCILKQFAAQLDSVLSANLNKYLESHPEVTNLTLKLLYKFVKLIINTDTFIF